SISDFDGADTSPGAFSIVVVPGTIQVSGGSGSRVFGIRTTPTFLAANFRVELDGVDGSHITAVRGLHVSAAKLTVAAAAGPRQFQPGALQFEDIRVGAAPGGPTVGDLDQWVTDVAQGSGQPTRNGRLLALNPSLSQTLAEVDLVGLTPLAFPPFPT